MTSGLVGARTTIFPSCFARRVCATSIATTVFPKPVGRTTIVFASDAFSAIRIWYSRSSSLELKYSTLPLADRFQVNATVFFSAALQGSQDSVAFHRSAQRIGFLPPSIPFLYAWPSKRFRYVV